MTASKNTPIKKCFKCEQEKPTDEFYLIKRKDRSKPTLYHRCKSCCANVKANSKSYYRNYELVKKYGITLEEYEKEVATRRGVCDICQIKTTTMHVDHCHTSGKIRGYLCGPCNRGIGLLKDSSEVLLKAAKYLERNTQ